MQDIGKSLVIIGLVLVVAGAVLWRFPTLFGWVGKLPGDIVRRTEHTTIYFPVVTCLILSAALSLILWLINHFRR